jgi:hypothetical protein
VILAPTVIFAPVLFADRSLAFRDTGVFYHPLYEWVETQWHASGLPLWNPHVNFGVPVVGEASTSIFYPGKLLLVLPIDFAWKFKLYVVGHVFLAAAGAYYAARVLGTTREAAALAAVAYACGGAVLFQHCNVVFLVGAAWLPWAIAAAEQMLTQHSARAAAGLGVVLALMVLGGDPQMAYHAGLAAGAYGAALVWTRRTAENNEAQQRTPIGRALLHTGSLLMLAAVTAFVLSAVQTLPAGQAARHSDRASYHAPRNIYEAAQVIASDKDGVALASQGLFRDPEPDTHAGSIYQFSFAPWHLGEYVWPNLFGQYFPQYRRWMMFTPSEPRIWNQSVYLGLLPLLLGLAGLRLRCGSVRMQWLSWCLVLAVLGSFGSYGISWFLRHGCYLSGQPHWGVKLPGDQVGGIYWLAVTLLPSYAYFRFPAKLLTFAACPLCLLAALGFDRLRENPTSRLRWIALGIAGATAAGAVGLLLGRSAFEQFGQRMAPDAIFGLFDTRGAYRDLLVSLVHALIASGA